MSKNITELKIIEGELKEVHPALDFLNDIALVTIPFPTYQKTQTGDGEKAKIELTTDKIYWTITSNKEIFHLNDKELLDRKLFASGKCCIANDRWNYTNSLKQWLEKNVKSNPKELFLQIQNRYKQYLDYKDTRLYSFFPLWTIGTYFYLLFPAYPIVFLNGSTGSGKSKTIDTTEQLAFNAINSSNISDASTYRIVQGSRSTLLLDENEKIADSEEARTLINIVLAGFKKGALVYRLEKKRDSYIPTKYEVHCPKMIANIRGIKEEALKNRCITLIMTPSQSSKANDYPSGNEPGWQPIRDNLYIFLMNHWKDIRETKKEIIASDFGLNGYSWMMWEPILTLAKYFEKFIGNGLFEVILCLAKEKVAERKEELLESQDRHLLRIIKNLFNMNATQLGKEETFIPTDIIYKKFYEEFDEDNKPRWLNCIWVGRMINSLDVGKRIKENNERGYLITTKTLNEALERFGIAE